MDNLSSSYIHSYMVDIITAGIKQQIPRLYSGYGNFSSLCRLVTGTSARRDTKMSINLHRKAGTVRTVC